MKNRIKSIKHYYSFNLKGNSYDIPAANEDEITNDYYVILSDKDFLEKHGAELIGKDLLEKEMEEFKDKESFDDTGNLKDESIGITETYSIVTKDGGELEIDFYDKDDREGAIEVTKETAATRDFVKAYNENKICINELYESILKK